MMFLVKVEMKHEQMEGRKLPDACDIKHWAKTLKSFKSSSRIRLVQESPSRRFKVVKCSSIPAWQWQVNYDPR